MNILQITNKVPYPPKDGGSIAVMNIANGFVKNGIKLTMLSLNTKKHYVDVSDLSEINSNIKLKTFLLDTDINLKDAVFNLLFSNLPYNAQRFISEGFLKLIETQIINENYDIIQIEGLYLMPYVENIRKYSKAIISYRSHNIEHEIWEKNSELETNPVKRLYLKNLAKRIKTFELSFINKYDVLVPISPRDGDLLNNLGNIQPVHVSPTGLDSVNYKINKPIDSQDISFFHIGSMDWLPNISGLIWFLEEVWSEIVKVYPDLKFKIAGRNAPLWFEEKLKKYAVKYFGEVENSVDFMKENSIMIVPLHSGSGMRIKIIEAMAAGRIVISTSKGMEGIPAEENKHFLSANNSEEFLSQITSILEKKKDINSISNSAENFISKKFDNIAISKSLINFYSDL